MQRKNFLILVCLLISVFAFPRYHLTGKIKIQYTWQNKLYVFKMRGYTNNISLVDSFNILKDGSFDHYFPKQEDKYTIYKILIPLKGEFETNEVDGLVTNFFFLITEKDGSCRVTANGDSLYFTTRYFNSTINSRLLYFQELQRPFYHLASGVRESIEKHPENTYSIQTNFMNQITFHKDNIKTELQKLLLAEVYEPIARIELFYLFGAQDGELDPAYAENILSRFRPNHQNSGLFKPGPSIVNPFSKQIPDVSLMDTGGIIVPLPVGDPYLVIDFWWSGCGACRRANLNVIPAMLSANVRKDYDFISVSIDPKLSDWKSAIQKDKISWPQYLDKDHTFQKLLNETGMPFFLVIKDHQEVFHTTNVFALQAFLKKM